MPESILFWSKRTPKAPKSRRQHRWPQLITRRSSVQIRPPKTNDLYAIFGNSLDNAIRAVLALDDAQKRVIAVSVWAKNSLMLFQFENYFEGNLIFDGDLPRTTKGSKDYHGYGIKSIRQIAQKFGGQMTLHTENNLFLLRVSIPLPPTDET